MTADHACSGTCGETDPRGMLVLAALVRAGQFRQRRAAPVTIVFLVLGVAVVAAIALLAVGRLGELPEVEPDRPPTLLPDTRLAESEDVDSLRFAVGLRGYRMDEVDDVLDRLAADIAERDARITELERGASVPGPGAAVATATGSGTAWAEASAADFTPAADVVEPIRGASTE